MLIKRSFSSRTWLGVVAVALAASVLLMPGMRPTLAQDSNGVETISGKFTVSNPVWSSRRFAPVRRRSRDCGWFDGILTVMFDGILPIPSNQIPSKEQERNASGHHQD